METAEIVPYVKKKMLSRKIRLKETSLLINPSLMRDAYFTILRNPGISNYGVWLELGSKDKRKINIYIQRLVNHKLIKTIKTSKRKKRRNRNYANVEILFQLYTSFLFRSFTGEVDREVQKNYIKDGDFLEYIGKDLTYAFSKRSSEILGIKTKYVSEKDPINYSIAVIDRINRFVDIIQTQYFLSYHEDFERSYLLSRAQVLYMEFFQTPIPTDLNYKFKGFLGANKEKERLYSFIQKRLNLNRRHILDIILSLSLIPYNSWASVIPDIEEFVSNMDCTFWPLEGIKSKVLNRFQEYKNQEKIVLKNLKENYVKSFSKEKSFRGWIGYNKNQINNKLKILDKLTSSLKKGNLEMSFDLLGDLKMSKEDMEKTEYYHLFQLKETQKIFEKTKSPSR